MATINNTLHAQSFQVIHPLHDEPEAKCQSEGLDPIAMTPAVNISLKVLRGYLVLMSLMLLYHVLDLAGAFHRWK
ncbi:MAG: hypothetical protein ACLGRW_15735 [Acidobacteriota bacterium]